jgi:hypothetical protein
MKRFFPEGWVLSRDQDARGFDNVPRIPAVAIFRRNLD